MLSKAFSYLQEVWSKRTGPRVLVQEVWSRHQTATDSLCISQHTPVYMHTCDALKLPLKFV